MSMDDNDGQMIFGDLGGLKVPDICLTDEKKPWKTSPRKPVPTGDRTRARCMTGTHATAWPTAVDSLNLNSTDVNRVLFYKTQKISKPEFIFWTWFLFTLPVYATHLNLDFGYGSLFTVMLLDIINESSY